MQNRSPTTLSISIAPLPIPGCTTPPSERSSTPFASSSMPERFEYPFTVIPPLLLTPLGLPAATSPATPALTNGSIVPPSGSGRGMDMASFASFSAHIPTIALPYPSATASASQVLDQRQVDALPVARAPYVYDHHHYSAAQLCLLASMNSPMPPSLALKRRRLQLAEELLGRGRALLSKAGRPQKVVSQWSNCGPRPVGKITAGNYTRRTLYFLPSAT